MHILVTGGAGFIGSHLVRFLVNKYPDYQIYNLDKLTYAGNLANLQGIGSCANYRFIQGDICNSDFIAYLFDQHTFDCVIHLAAESHVDRSIHQAEDFVKTNVMGTVCLLEAAKNSWKASATRFQGKLFYQVSTDEVYGSLGETGLFTEQTAYNPHSPYAASKASADHFVRAYADTYALPIVISNCSNNYGPYQFPEKFIPYCINSLIKKKPIEIYGNGENIRDWLFVEDHVKAIDLIFKEALKASPSRAHQTYNIGGKQAKTNIAVAKLICKYWDEKFEKPLGSSEKEIEFVPDRPGHDFRYAIDSSKIQRELHWQPLVSFEQGLHKTIDWYVANKDWLDNTSNLITP